MHKIGSFKGRIVLSGVLLVAVLGTAAAYFWEQKTPQAGPQVQLPARHRATDTLFLASPTPWPLTGRQVDGPPLIMRELARQALLIAARDGLGLYTRDGVLREDPPPGAAAAESSLTLDLQPTSRDDIPVVVRDAGPGGAVWLNQRIPLDPHDPRMVLPVALQTCEAMSRGTFVDMLRHAGFSAAKPSSTLPSNRAARSAAESKEALEDAERNLGLLTEISQFAAVRHARGAIRESGPSERWLGILVRGYANLGQLSSYQWSAATDVFGGRSLLYAQRMVVQDPRSAVPLWHRAYAEALLGFHKPALDDLARAHALAAGKRPPEWVQLLEPLCKYQTAKLADLAAAHPALAGPGMYFCFMTVENCMSNSAVIETAKAALEVNPRCMRLMDAIMQHAGVAYNHVMTEAAPQVQHAGLATALRALDPLPADVQAAAEPVRRHWQDPNVLAALTRSLDHCPEPAEPSWSALGRIIGSIDFVLVERRAQFMAWQWSVDASDFVNKSMPLVADHPFRAILEGYACLHPGKPDMPRLHQLLANLDLTDPRASMWQGIDLTMRAGAAPGRMQGNSAWHRMINTVSSGAYAQESVIALNQPNQLTKGPFWMETARRIHETSPYSPTAEGALLLLDWNEYQKDAAAWTAQSPGHPLLNYAMASHYSSIKQPEKAEPYWRAYLRVAPDAWAYRQLASDYLASGSEAKWLQTLEESLKQEDYGLDHAYTEAIIAGHYMDKGDYATALPHSEASAESYSAWGLNSAARCYEGLKQWDKAAQCQQACAERYGNPLPWFWFCKRTGHGDLAGAEAAAREFVGAPSNPVGWDKLTPLIEFYLVDGDRPRAKTYLRMLLDQYGDPWAGLNLMVLDLKDHDPLTARDILARTLRNGDQFVFPGTSQGLPEMMQVARMLQTCMDHGAGATLDLNAVAKAIAAADAGKQADVWYVTGEFLKSRGHTDAARRCLERAAAVPQGERTNVLLAIGELRAMGATPAAR